MSFIIRYYLIISFIFLKIIIDIEIIIIINLSYKLFKYYIIIIIFIIDEFFRIFYLLIIIIFMAFYIYFGNVSLFMLLVHCLFMIFDYPLA